MDPRDLGVGTGVFVPVVIVLLIVGRFLARELRDRRIPFNRFYALPAIVGVVAAVLVGFAATSAPNLDLELAAGTLAAIVVGSAIGLAVDRFTSVRLGPGGTSVIVRGSWTTAAIWIVALALRLAGRYIAFAFGLRSAGTTLTLNAVLLVLLAAAILVLRFRLHARAVALRGDVGVPSSPLPELAQRESG